MGKSIFDTSTESSFIHCNLASKTAYTYTLAIRNSGGYYARTVQMFRTGGASTSGSMTVLPPTFPAIGAVRIPIALSCDASASRSLYAELFDAQDNRIQTYYFGCCALELYGLSAGINYTARMGFWDKARANMTVVIPSGVQSRPSTSLRYATLYELVMDVAPSIGTGVFEYSAAMVEVVAGRASTGTRVFQATLSCYINGADRYCAGPLSITGLDATSDDYSYVVSARTWGDFGTSAWTNASYDADIGQQGSISFPRSEYSYFDGDYMWLQVDRIYGTTAVDTVTFEVSGAVSWSCQSTSAFTTCVVDSTGNNTGTSVSHSDDSHRLDFTDILQ